jgi:hypothetical protein
VEGTPFGRAAVVDQPEGLTIVVPAPRVWPVIGFLLLWLGGWATGEAFALRQLFGGAAPLPAQAFLAVWAAFWTLGGAGAIAACLWMLMGHERLTLGPDALTLRREVFGLGRAKRYPLDRVTRLEAGPLPDLAALAASSPAGAAAAARARAQARTLDPGAVLRVIGIGGPGLVFIADGRPVRFGIALDPTEASQLVSLLRSRHAFPGDSAAA